MVELTATHDRSIMTDTPVDLATKDTHLGCRSV